MNIIEQTIKTLEEYLHEETWRYTEPPLGKKECELFLKLLKEPEKVEEKPKGRWRKIYLPLPLSDSAKKAYRCSECNLTYDVDTHYCPNCGADMRGEE